MFETRSTRSPNAEIISVVVIIFSIIGIGIMTGLIPSSYPGSRPHTVKVCPECGVVESIVPVSRESQGSSTDAMTGGVPGAVAGNPIDAGRGKTLTTVAGAAGGVNAGDEVGKNMEPTTYYRVIIRMRDGSVQNFTRDTDHGVHVGDRIKIANGSVIRE